jgi:hypothetical protein
MNRFQSDDSNINKRHRSQENFQIQNRKQKELADDPEMLSKQIKRCRINNTPGELR